VEFHDQVEYLINLLKDKNSNSYDSEALNQLEKLLEEYAKSYKQKTYNKSIK
jgi:hypothetical protein